MAEKLRRSEVGRRMRPRTTEDFEVLYNELESWRLQQTRAIQAANLTPGDRRAALQALLHKACHLHPVVLHHTLCTFKDDELYGMAWHIPPHQTM